MSSSSSPQPDPPPTPSPNPAPRQPPALSDDDSIYVLTAQEKADLDQGKQIVSGFLSIAPLERCSEITRASLLLGRVNPVLATMRNQYHWMIAERESVAQMNDSLRDAWERGRRGEPLSDYPTI